jgi:Leucine-rich repeat (LRR) protein
VGKKIIVSLFFIILVISSISVNAVEIQDSLALVALYDSTNGDSWTTNTYWKSDSAVSKWYGVTVTGNRVTSLSLGNNNLVGAIPPSIGDLDSLTGLLLWDNQLTDSIPQEIGNLTSLTFLGLSNNQLTGSIPPEIGSLTNLGEVYLSGNQLTGSIPPEIGNLKNLEKLILHNNQLTDSIPSEIGNLTNLTFLYLYNNHLTGSIPPEIGGLTDLTYLYLYENDLTGSIPSEIGGLTSLLELRLNDNQLTGSIPSEIGGLTSLMHLYLFDNQLTGSIPPGIGNLTNLRNLNLSNNQLTGSIPSEINSLTSLQWLLLLDNNLEDLPSLAALSSLEYLYIQNNKFTFEDIEHNVGVPGSGFTYSPQDSVGEAKDTTVNQGSSLTISVSVGGEHNLYQWKKNGGTITDAEDSIYTMDPVTSDDAGSYICEITNSVAGALTLYSRPINVSVNDTFMVVTAPNGGENWQVGSGHNITWTSAGTSGAVKIEYSTNNGSDWEEIIASIPDTGVYSWIIPGMPSDNCLIMITDTNGNLSDTSDSVFRISPVPFIAVTSPNGGENWQVGSGHNITWTSAGTSGAVKIEYSTNNGSDWEEIIASTPDDGTYLWTIPSMPSTSCLVRVSDTDDNPSDQSNDVFTISFSPFITVTSPVGGEDWKVDSTYNITWNSWGTSGGVKIEYSTNNGSDWEEIIASIPDTAAYSWTIPDTPSDSCLVMITDTNGSLTDTSDAIFTISSASAVPTHELPTEYSVSVIRGIITDDQLEVRYALPEKDKVKFSIYDISGAKVREISKENPAGVYLLKINMSGKSAGVYFLRMEANDRKFLGTLKFTLM